MDECPFSSSDSNISSEIVNFYDIHVQYPLIVSECFNITDHSYVPWQLACPMFMPHVFYLLGDPKASFRTLAGHCLDITEIPNAAVSVTSHSHQSIVTHIIMHHITVYMEHWFG